MPIVIFKIILTSCTNFGTLILMKIKESPVIILSVRFFKTDSGTEPVRDWLKTLAHEHKKTIGEDIKTVQYGWPIGMPVVRKLDTGLWEVRSRVKNGTARVIFTVYGGMMILLHGFIKKSNKTPLDDIATAKNRMKQLQ